MTHSSDTPVAVITGSTRGIGLATARAFAEDGYLVVVNGRDDTATREVAALLESEGHQAVPVAGDVSDEAVAERLVTTHDRLDVLVNNAGISPRRADGHRTPALEMSREEWDRVIDVNLTAPWWLSVLAGRRMVEQERGVILFMSSLTARAYFTTSGAHYSTSKTALVGLTRALAGELANSGVRVCGIAPGRIMTDMAQTLDPAIGEELLKLIPLGRAGTPEDIAGAAVFLASQQANYLTGVTLDVNGGAWMN